MQEPLLMLMLITTLLAVLPLIGLLWMIRRLSKGQIRVAEDARLWDGRDYRCPACVAPLEPGWVVLGKGAIWSDRARGRPGAFAHIGQALPNTLNFGLRSAVNMAWRCQACGLVLVDHSKLVTKAGQNKAATP